VLAYTGTDAVGVDDDVVDVRGDVDDDNVVIVAAACDALRGDVAGDTGGDVDDVVDGDAVDDAVVRGDTAIVTGAPVVDDDDRESGDMVGAVVCTTVADVDSSLCARGDVDVDVVDVDAADALRGDSETVAVVAGTLNSVLVVVGVLVWRPSMCT
jgi:hypothetical protein